jgi:hypothetical protein
MEKVQNLENSFARTNWFSPDRSLQATVDLSKFNSRTGTEVSKNYFSVFLSERVISTSYLQHPFCCYLQNENIS